MPLPSFWPSITVRITAPEGTVFTRVAYEDGRPRHVYASVGKAGSTVQCAAAGISRLVSGCLQAGVPLELIASWLSDHTHDRTDNGRYEATSLVDAVSKALVRVVEADTAKAAA